MDIATYTTAARERRIAILRAKNHDYSGAGKPFFANFLLCEELGICDVETGIRVRMADKLGRIRSLMNQDATVAGESIQDTLDDLINYAAILCCYLTEGDEGSLQGVIDWTHAEDVGFIAAVARTNGQDVIMDDLIRMLKQGDEGGISVLGAEAVALGWHLAQHRAPRDDQMAHREAPDV